MINWSNLQMAENAMGNGTPAAAAGPGAVRQ